MTATTEPGTVTIEWLEEAAAAEAPPCQTVWVHDLIGAVVDRCEQPSVAHVSGYCARGHRQAGWLCRQHAEEVVALVNFLCGTVQGCDAPFTVVTLS